MELFKILGTIAINNSEANSALDSTSEKARGTAKDIGSVGDSGEKSGGKFGAAMGKVGSVAASIGKTVAVGMAAAGTAVAGLVSQAVNEFASYEQLVGGVDTLFKDSSEKVQEYAKNAYATAGLSANEYMETVTSFSASLLQSLGGDTEAAADKANTAIIDMSDNANKMGTSMEMIQNAYQGFAKQNYTMLDNLKLGYGGTKEEMERLLADAQEFSGIKYDISSYADVVDAIHVIQTEMGIAGTTAAEASGTISGSMSAVKASWKNLLTAVASDDLPFDDYVDQFVNSATAMTENMLPRIQTALEGVVSLIDKLAPVIIGKIPELLTTLLPSVVTAATGIVNAIVEIFPDIVSAVVNMIPALIQALMQIINAIIAALPQIMEVLVAALPTLIPQLVTGLVQMIVLLCTMLPQIIQPIIDYLPEIIVSIVTALIQNLPALLAGIGQLIVGIVQAIPQLLSALWEAITTLASDFANNLFGKIEGWIRKLFPKSADTVLSILKTMQDAFSTLISNIKEILSVVVTVVSTPFKLAWNAIKFVWDTVVDFFKMIWENIKTVFSVVDSVLAGDFKGAWDGIKKIWSNVVGFFKDIVSNIKNAFANVGEILTAPFRKAKEAIGNIVDNIKGFFKGLKLEFPKIKLPHFSIKGSFSLSPPSVPKLSIDWYKKAMNNAMLLTSPTIFGYNAATGNLMGGGEAGDEVVSGANTLMNMIRRAVASENGNLAYLLQQLLALLAEYFPQVLEAMERDVVLDTGETVGALAAPMNRALGKLSSRKDRGR